MMLLFWGLEFEFVLQIIFYAEKVEESQNTKLIRFNSCLIDNKKSHEKTTGCNQIYLNPELSLRY